MKCFDPPHKYKSGECVSCGKPSFWRGITAKPRKKHSPPTLSQAEILARLEKIKTPKGWTLIGTVLDDDGTPAQWFGKGHGKARKHQTISI